MLSTLNFSKIAGVIGLEELYLANQIVKKGLAPPEEVRAALESLDRAQGKGDLLGRLGQRFPALAQPDFKEKAAASAARYMLTKHEAAFAARVRGAGAVPPAVLDAVIAEQRAEGLTWKLADRLVKTGKLSMVRSTLIQKDAANEIKKQEEELVRKHRSSRFQETVQPGASVSGRRTAEYGGNLESSGEGFAFGMAPGPAAQPSGGGDEAGEATIKLSPQIASGLQPLDGAMRATGGSTAVQDATVMLGRGDAVPPESESDGATIKLPAPPQRATPSGSNPAASQRPKPQATPAPGPLQIGANLAGKYEVKAELGRGGMGVVYRALSKEKGSDVALKAVPAAKGTGPAADALQRFKREILTATMVESENVCEVYDAGQAEGLVYMAMELIEGETLRDLVKRDSPLPHARALELFKQVVKGVEACHSKNVIHRDLKPENVRVTKAGVAKLVDFGIARLISKDTVIQEQVFVTIKGTLSGTPAYVAPELVMEPDLVDARADLYSLGVILYELLTGKLPYASKGGNIRETLRDALEARPIPLEESAPKNPVPEPLQRVLWKLLEKDQLVRYQTAAEVLAALDELAKPAAPAAGADPEKPKSITARIFRAITSIFRKKT